MKKILIVPPMPWYMETNAEYLIRYLSDEFFIEVADVPYPPYENFLDRFPDTNPFQRNPDDYDLIWPILPSHWVITEKDKYAHKVATVFYQPNEGRIDGVAIVGATTPLAERSVPGSIPLRFGVDTDLFKPLGFKKDPNVLNVGMIGSLNNPRRLTKDVWLALKDMPGVNFMLFPTHMWNQHDVDVLGGQEILKYVRAGEKSWPGIANIYNRMDVLIRPEIDPGYSFPVIEAASCGVPVIATDSGIDNCITEAHGGILIKPDYYQSNGSPREWLQNNTQEVVRRVVEAVKFMRDYPAERLLMGRDARAEVEKNWTWAKHINSWREFFRKGIDNAKKM